MFILYSQETNIVQDRERECVLGGVSLKVSDNSAVILDFFHCLNYK